MLTKVPLALFIVLALIVPAVEARSKASRAEFQRLQPCPATGAKRGPCPGYIVDHVSPLCAGGADHHSNMQWQTVNAAKAKDRSERSQCRK